MNVKWNEVGSVDPKALCGERTQLHYGAWILGSVANSLLAPTANDSHTNLGWTGSGAAFATRSLGDPSHTGLELDVAGLELAFRAAGETRAVLPLVGRTVDQALAWVEAFARATWATSAAVARREYADFPDSELARGGTFAVGDRAARAELGRWFDNARSVMSAIEADEPTASPIRTWPHHFDIAMLIDAGDGRSIGAGLSPGDGSYDEPYFYVYAYPTPDPSRLSVWSGGAGGWTTTGFTGALLTATEIVANPDPARAAQAFLRDAIAHFRVLLG